MTPSAGTPFFGCPRRMGDGFRLPDSICRPNRYRFRSHSPLALGRRMGHPEVGETEKKVPWPRSYWKKRYLLAQINRQTAIMATVNPSTKSTVKRHATGKPSSPRVNTPPASASQDGMIGAAPATARGALTTPQERDAHKNSDARHGWIVRLMTDDGPGILRLLWRILGREADVMDAYQDCFCKLAQLTGRREPRNARAYAYRTAGNIAIEMIRTRQRRGAHWDNVVATKTQRANPTEDSTPGSEVLHKEQLRKAIGDLPPHLRNVVVLRDLSRIRYDEIGRVLGIEPTTARVYRRHAVVQLAKTLGVEN